jgi:hypothetical protein
VRMTASNYTHPALWSRQPLAQRGQHRQIGGALSRLVLERGIGAFRQQ